MVPEKIPFGNICTKIGEWKIPINTWKTWMDLYKEIASEKVKCHLFTILPNLTEELKSDNLPIILFIERWIRCYDWCYGWIQLIELIITGIWFSEHWWSTSQETSTSHLSYNAGWWSSWRWWIDCRVCCAWEACNRLFLILKIILRTY